MHYVVHFRISRTYFSFYQLCLSFLLQKANVWTISNKHDGTPHSFMFMDAIQYDWSLDKHNSYTII